MKKTNRKKKLCVIFYLHVFKFNKDGIEKDISNKMRWRGNMWGCKMSPMKLLLFGQNEQRHVILIAKFRKKKTIRRNEKKKVKKKFMCVHVVFFVLFFVNCGSKRMTISKFCVLSDFYSIKHWLEQLRICWLFLFLLFFFFFDNCRKQKENMPLEKKNKQKGKKSSNIEIFFILLCYFLSVRHLCKRFVYAFTIEF